MYKRTTLLIPSHVACQPLKENELVRMVVSELPSIPAGANPFHYDATSMGANITAEYQALFYSGKCLKEMDLYHVNGQVFRLNMYPKEQALKPMFRMSPRPIAAGSVEPWTFYRLYQMVPEHVEAVQVNYVDDDYTDRQYICYKDELLVSLKVLNEAASDELYTLIADMYFDEDLIDQAYNAISRLMVDETGIKRPFTTAVLKSLLEA